MPDPMTEEEDVFRQWIDSMAKGYDPTADLPTPAESPEPRPRLPTPTPEAFPFDTTPEPRQAFDPERAPAQGRGERGRFAGGPRPTASELPDWQPKQEGAWLALLGDMLINRGKGADRIYKAYGLDGPRDPLDRELKKARIEHLRGGNPFAQRRLELDEKREARMADQAEALQAYRDRYEGRQGEAFKHKLGVDARLSDPTHPYAEDFRRKWIREGVPEELVAGLSYQQMKDGEDFLKAYVRRNQAGMTGQARREEAAPTMALSDAYDARQAERSDQYAQKREERGATRARASTAREERLKYAEMESKIEDFEEALDELIAAKGEDYVLPARGNIGQRLWIEGSKALEGGTGMDEADTRLFLAGKAGGLGEYLQIAANAPNTLPEQATAFDNFFQTGSLGSMKRRIQRMRRRQRRNLDKRLNILKEEAPLGRPRAQAQGDSDPEEAALGIE